jgi:hypothetical protein
MKSIQLGKILIVLIVKVVDGKNSKVDTNTYRDQESVFKRGNYTCPSQTTTQFAMSPTNLLGPFIYPLC